MTGLPTGSVKLDDGSGTFPYDVSAFVRLPSGVSITRGRGDELGEVQPSQLTLTFDNTTGVFTLGSGTYGIVVDQKIQVSLNAGAGAVKRFTGYVDDWPVDWPDGSDTYSEAQVTAVDQLSRLARRKLRSMVENEILEDAPVAYYTLAEPAGSPNAGDTSGNGCAALTPASFGFNSAVVFGNATGPGFDDLTAAQFSGGQYLQGARPTTSGTSATTGIFFLRASAPAVTEWLTVWKLGDLEMDSSGRILTSLGTLTSPLSYADGNAHHAAVTFDGTTLTLYVDGASVASTPASLGVASDPVSIGGYSRPPGTQATFTGTLAHAAYWNTALSAARVAAHAAAGLTGFVTDTADQRIARLAAYGNIPTGNQNLEAGQQVAIVNQNPTGATNLDAITAVTTAEGGLVFIQGDGKLALQNKAHRAIKAQGAAALTLTADQINPDATVGGGKQYIVNTATGSREGGAPQSSVNQTSLNTYEEYPKDFSTLLLSTDAVVLDLLQWTTGVYGTYRPRLPGFTLDLLTLPAATVQAVLNLELGDLVTISGLPSQAPGSLGSLLVEGWTETLTHDSWTITLNTVPSAIFLGPVVNTASATCDSGNPVYF